MVRRRRAGPFPPITVSSHHKVWHRRFFFVLHEKNQARDPVHTAQDGDVLRHISKSSPFVVVSQKSKLGHFLG